MILKDPMLWRIFWKEYRAQRSFWLVIAGFGIALMLLCAAWLDASDIRTNGPWAIALAMPMFYALGCGAVLFASEEEEGTTELLRIMAARTSRLYVAKVGFSLVSTLALAGLLVAVAVILTLGHFDRLPLDFRDKALLSACVTPIPLVWGILFSALCRKVLAAVCLATSGPLLILAVDRWLPGNQHRPESAIAYSELALCVPVLYLAYLAQQQRMAGRTRSLSWPQIRRRRGAAAVNVLDRLAEARDTAPAWRRLFLRLVWLEVRHALSVGHVLWVAGIALFLVALAFPSGGLHGRPHLEPTMLGVFIFPTLIGVWVFQAEGGRRTRFLGELGVPPRAVWLSKQLVWLGLTIVVTTPFLVVVELVSRETTQRSLFHGDLPGASASAFVIALACVGYAAGQFASILVPRGITAGFAGFAIYALLVPWTWLMIAVQVPLWISVAPLAVFMLAATLVWSRHWLLESASGRSWRQLALAVGATLFAVWAGASTFRVLEVPLPEDFPWVRTVGDFRQFYGAPIAPITDAEAETAEMYRRARSE